MASAAKVIIHKNNEAVLQIDEKKLTLKFAGSSPLNVKNGSINPPEDYNSANRGAIIVGIES